MTKVTLKCDKCGHVYDEHSDERPYLHSYPDDEPMGVRHIICVKCGFVMLSVDFDNVSKLEE